MELFPSYGGAAFSPKSKKVIRLILKGCTNRPFFHIIVQELFKKPTDPVIEQVGCYDPLPNDHNEKLVAINFQRLDYWLKQGALTSEPVKRLLGLGGYFPVHPNSFKTAYKKRFELMDEIKKLKIEAAKIISEEKPETVSQQPSESESSSKMPPAQEELQDANDSPDKDSKS